MKRIKLSHLAGAVLACLSIAAQAFPDKPITIVSPFPPGSSSDIIPRLIAPIMGKELGVTVLVDNRAGANGSLGATFVARAPADGYTLLLGTTGVLAINQWIYTNPQYQPDRDFTAITDAAATPNLLVVNPKIPASNLKELVAYAKAHPGALTYASAGNGSTSHLCGEQLRSLAGVDAVHVPYKGPAPAAQDLIGGSVSMMCDNFSNVVNYVKGGKLKAIVITGPERNPLLPDVPTSAQAGYPGLQAGIWYGFVAPAGTPPEIIDKLNHAITTALHDPGVKERLDGLGLSAVADSPAAFKAFMAQESARMRKIVEASGARLD